MFQSNLLKAAMVKNGITSKQLAEMMGVNVSTLYRKISRDGDFTRQEVNTIIDSLGLTAEEYKEIFFAPELA